jgi:hypothetical protein
MSVDSCWQAELEHPTEKFFEEFARRIRGPFGSREATAEAIRFLGPRIDRAFYLPHIPHGLLGLWGVWRIRESLSEASFLRALATQLHMMAKEKRIDGEAPESDASGPWEDLEGDFRRVLSVVSHDMANQGHKAVIAHRFGDLCQQFPERAILDITTWYGEKTPCDSQLHNLAQRRLEGEWSTLKVLTAEEHRCGVREICDLGLTRMLDAFCGRISAGTGPADLLSMLVLAASEKLLDARRDLEGMTSWNLVYLATVAMAPSLRSDPAVWAQAAAIVNFFPTDEEDDRPVPRQLSSKSVNPAEGLREAILDGEPLDAMALAGLAIREQGLDPVLSSLAEAASRNDPAFNHAHQILAVAAACDLGPQLPFHVQEALVDRALGKK